jgi:hypothetical protein
MRDAILVQLLRLAGLPSLDAPRFDTSDLPRLEHAANSLLSGDADAVEALPVPPIEFLRWLAENRPVLFHGSSRDDLAVLEPIRLSRDATEFGDRQAVYATSDPVWAIYFATLRRGKPFSTRNGSLALAGSAVYPRWYFFSVNAPHGRPRFGPGSLYVLPRAGFVSQPPLHRAIDTAQWLSVDAVRPLARIEVTGHDFPFREDVISHVEREPMLATMVKAGRRARRQRSTRR